METHSLRTKVKILVTLTLTAATLLALAACGGRSLPAQSDGQTVSDGGPTPDKGAKKDACVAPRYCSSNSECKAGFKCKGCFGNPCCPKCEACFKKCVPDNGCNNNKDCSSSEYCELGPGCGKGAPGACVKRPGPCPKYLVPPPPVCGCDDKQYGNACEAQSKGVNVANKGFCKSKCQELSKQYNSALLKAKTCCSTCNQPGAECTKQVQSALACGCPTFISTWNTAALKSITMLQNQWKSGNCASKTSCPPGGACKPLTKGVCDGFGATGYCKDK